MVHVVIHSYKDSVQTQDLIYLDFQGSFESVDNIQLSNVDIGDLTLSTDSAQLIIGHHKLTGKKVKLQRPLAVIHKRRDMMDEGGDEYDVVTILKEKYVFSDRPGLIVQETSSVAVGAGFHTFVVFLGPYIAQVTLAAYRCGSTDLMIRDPQSFRLVECVVEDNNVNVMLITVWNIFQKVKWESFAWGAGTAFGELPPYFIARAFIAKYDEDKYTVVAETEEKIKEFALMSDDDEPTLKTKLLQSVFAMIQRLGFFGILLFASVPNPLFDLAGITCGHFKVPFSRFFGATFIGKACVKATIQTLLVILIFSHDTLYYLLDFIKSNTPASFDQYIERIVRDQTSMFKGSEIKDQNTTPGTIWNYLLSIMVAYYVFCSIEALEYFEPDNFAAMNIPSKEDRDSASPMEESTVMSYIPATGSFYMPPNSQHHSLQDYYNTQPYHAPGPEYYPNIMYPDSSVDQPPSLMFFEPGNIPSPSSTLSSHSLQNMAFAGPLCFSKDYPQYATPLYPSPDQKFTITVEKDDCAQEKKEHVVHVVATAKKQKDTKSYHKRHSRDKSKKRCSNCFSNNSPSWRRSISPPSKGALLCNACGLYEKTAKKKRMLVINDDGTTKVVRKRDARDYSCSTCGVQNVARWRRVHDSILCEKCARRSQRA
ncbi:hypothetical protein HPULCUR_005920 [Helicostylum pulchrum]|uniref:GATA-type domain-containing protein n=1 Tax=Helicostylum pulchrum TaxID=562976 RepID=A0ABP9Y0F4_9FUNG